MARELPMPRGPDSSLWRGWMIDVTVLAAAPLDGFEQGRLAVNEPRPPSALPLPSRSDYPSLTNWCCAVKPPRRARFSRPLPLPRWTRAGATGLRCGNPSGVAPALSQQKTAQGADCLQDAAP